ncbi:MAG: Sulfotransferase [Pedosphaera sp.]|nr:Sulfotransferase [Pedosphaera sp.]
MAHYLAARPDIFMARKEMHVFGSDLSFGPQFYRRTHNEYLGEFEEWKDQARGGEASVWYLYSKRAAAELKAFNPDARIIIMLRDPVEMLHSMYYTFRWDGNEHLPTFEAALAASDERRAGRKITRQTYFAQGMAYREIIRFAEQVRRYWQAFGRERVHVVVYDDFAADVIGVYRNALDFLEVNSTRVESYFEPVNANKFIKSTALRTLLSDPLVRSTVLAIRPLLPRAMFGALQKADARLRKLNSRDGERPPLAPGLRQQLERELAPEVERLSELLGRDLTHWSRGGSPVMKASVIPEKAPGKIMSANDCAEAVRNLALMPGEIRLDAHS